MALKRVPEALTELGAVLASDPENVRALCLVAQCNIQTGRNSDADRAALAALGHDPHNDWACRLRSVALRQMKDLPRAVEAARAAVSLGPNVSVNWVVLALALAASTAEGSDQEAAEAASRAVELAPHAPEGHFAQGSVALARGRRREAVRSFRRVLAIDPHHVAAHNELARAQMQGSFFDPTGRLAAVARGFGSAVRTDPRFDTGRRNLNVVLQVFLTRTAYYISLLGTFAFYLSWAGAGEGVRLAVGVAVVLPVTYTARFVLRLDRELRAYLWSRARRPWVLAAGLLELVALSALMVGVVAASSTHWAFALAVMAAILGRWLMRQAVAVEAHQRPGWDRPSSPRSS